MKAAKVVQQGDSHILNIGDVELCSLLCWRSCKSLKDVVCSHSMAWTGVKS